MSILCISTDEMCQVIYYKSGNEGKKMAEILLAHFLIPSLVSPGVGFSVILYFT